MIRKFPGRERGMSAIPFVVALFLIVILAIIAYQGDQGTTEAKKKLDQADANAKQWKDRWEAEHNELLALTEVTGFGSQDPAKAGQPDRALLSAALTAALDKWREKTTIEFTADKYSATGTGGIIEKLQGDKIRVVYVPAKDQISNPSVQALLPILDSAAGRLINDVKRGFEEKDTEVKSKADIVAANAAAIAAKDAEAARIRAENDQAKRTSDETIRELRDQVANANQALQQAQTELETVKADSAKTEAALAGRLSQTVAQNQTLVRRDQPFLSEGPDGEVIGAGSGIVIINRGKKDMLLPGTIFKVLGRIKGGDLVPKGAIKVVVCNDNSAECRIVDESPSNRINVTDLIQSETYSPNRTMRFTLIGEFKKMGRADAERRLKALGAIVDTTVTTETHYLVVGTAPSGENLEDSEAYKLAKAYGVTPITEAQLASFTMY